MIFARYEDEDMGILIGEGITLDGAYSSLKDICLDRDVEVNPYHVTFWGGKKLNVTTLVSTKFTLE
jgi:hypothetical protein